MTVVRTRRHWRPVNDVTGTGCCRPMNGGRVAVVSGRRRRAGVARLTYNCVVAARAVRGDYVRLRTDFVVTVSGRRLTVHVTARSGRAASCTVSTQRWQHTPTAIKHGTSAVIQASGSSQQRVKCSANETGSSKIGTAAAVMSSSHAISWVVQGYDVTVVLATRR